MIIESGLPACLWAEAISYTTYIKNRVLSRTAQLTPYEYWNEKKPDMTHIRIFGSKAYVRNPTVSSKLEPRSQEGFFVGRCSTQNASRIYIPTTGKIVVSKDVKIDETILYRDHIAKDLLPSKVRSHTYFLLYFHIYIYILCIFICTAIYISIHVSMLCTYSPYIYTYIYIYIYTYINIYIYLYFYLYTYSLLFM
jgi:hypothetical protein